MTETTHIGWQHRMRTKQEMVSEQLGSWAADDANLEMREYDNTFGL